MADFSYRGKVVVVTGASAGIGEALVREAAGLGAHVVLLARREDRITSLARELGQGDVRALAFRCDVTRDEDVARAVAGSASELGGIDVVFANAGFGVAGTIWKLGVDDYRSQFETNVFGVIRTIKSALPELVKARGRIGVVGSTNGFVSLPGMSAYCMSKHAVRSLCVCLKHELKGSGVSVTHLAPGFIETEFRRIRNGQLAPDAIDRVPRWLQMPARTAARQMLSAVGKRRSQAVITLHSRLAIEIERIAPTLLSRALGMGGSRLTHRR